MRNMKKIFLLISAILLIVPVQAQRTLRLMTYNIKNATGMDGVCDFQRIANVINNASPDVVAVQEVDSVTNRSNQKYVLGEIAERTQMYACFAPAIDWRKIRNRSAVKESSASLAGYSFARQGRSPCIDLSGV